jgi:DNA-binding transcriptional ArsR family regulator
MRDLLALTRALSDANRVRALRALRGRELCVCQIVTLLELAASTVSKHMSVLESAGLVERSRRGRWVYYRRPAAAAQPAVDDALSWVDRSLEGDAGAERDAVRLDEILRIPVDELCRPGGGG